MEHLLICIFIFEPKQYNNQPQYFLYSTTNFPNSRSVILRFDIEMTVWMETNVSCAENLLKVMRHRKKHMSTKLLVLDVQNDVVKWEQWWIHLYIKKKPSLVPCAQYYWIHWLVVHRERETAHGRPPGWDAAELLCHWLIGDTLDEWDMQGPITLDRWECGFALQFTVTVHLWLFQHQPYTQSWPPGGSIPLHTHRHREERMLCTGCMLRTNVMHI